jgi:polyisoprenoid-binding protein YceI
MRQLIAVLTPVALLAIFQPCLAQEQTEAPQQRQRIERRAPGQPRAGQDTKAETPTPVAIENGVAKLSAENTKVEFIGTHLGDKPDPRLGGFEKFDGQLKFSDDGKTLDGIVVEFQTGSIWTLIPNLTNHLKTADFLDVENHPTAKFQSTKVVPSDKPGVFNVTGDFTLHGETKELAFPAEVKVDGSGVLLKSEFKFDRTLFGMDKMTDRVNPEVALTVSVGEKSKASGAAGETAGGGRGQGGRRGAGMDPAQFFARMDSDGDGKLSGDEIPERMQGRLKDIDTDGDNAISLEEMQEMIKRRQAGDGGQ